MYNPALISVVLPIYNVELYIYDAMQSLLNQTIQDFEIIVIDDCSTDQSISIIEAFNDPRITVIKKEVNKGLIDSLNIGFKEAKGKYIARMDGDDISLPDRFKKQLEVLENNPEIKVCGCWLQRFGNSDQIIKHKEHHDEIVAHLLLSCSMSMCAVMFNRKALEEYKFDDNKKHVEDYDFWSRLAWSCKFYNLQEVLYNYRIHETQVSTIYKSVQVQGDIAIKLFLFKKLNYNIEQFTDDIITKMLLLNQPLLIKEFTLFLKWLKELNVLNSRANVYAPNELEKVLEIIKKTVLFSLYFKNTSIGITKEWRTKALLKLPINDVLYILKLKSREIRKTIFKA